MVGDYRWEVEGGGGGSTGSRDEATRERLRLGLDPQQAVASGGAKKKAKGWNEQAH